MSMPTHWPPEHVLNWTPRQRQVLKLIGAGRTNAEIAEELAVTLPGAKWHVSEVLTKLGVASREEAAEYWRERGRLGSRAGRALQGLAGLLSGKALIGGATAVGVAGIAAGAVIIAGSLAETRHASEADPDAADQAISHVSAVVRDGQFERCGPFATLRQANVPIVTVHTAEGDWTLGGVRSPVGEFCETFIGPQDTSGIAVAGPFPRSATGIPEGACGFGRKSAEFGLVSCEVNSAADHVEIVTDSGSVRAPAVAAPASLGVAERFVYATYDGYTENLRVRSYDAAGSVLNDIVVFDDTPRAPTVLPDYTVSDFSGSADGPGGAGGTGGLFYVPAGGGDLLFEVSNTGSSPLGIIGWCQSGIVSWRYVDGPFDAGGSGTIALSVPAGNYSCSWLVRSETAGDWAIRGKAP
jgi:DNA-binding CsgD family transcriptional regulator